MRVHVCSLMQAPAASRPQNTKQCKPIPVMLPWINIAADNTFDTLHTHVSFWPASLKVKHTTTPVTCLLLATCSLESYQTSQEPVVLAVTLQTRQMDRKAVARTLKDPTTLSPLSPLSPQPLRPLPSPPLEVKSLACAEVRCTAPAGEGASAWQTAKSDWPKKSCMH